MRVVNIIDSLLRGAEAGDQDAARLLVRKRCKQLHRSGVEADARLADYLEQSNPFKALGIPPPQGRPKDSSWETRLRASYVPVVVYWLHHGISESKARKLSRELGEPVETLTPMSKVDAVDEIAQDWNMDVRTVYRLLEADEEIE